MDLTPGWQQYASTAPIIPIDKAFPLAASNASTSTAAKPTGMDPFSIGMGIANIGTSIAGLFGQKSAAEQQAEAVEQAAREQAKIAGKLGKTNTQLQLAEFGLKFLERRDRGGAAGALARLNEARDIVQRANIEANNPSLVALRSVQNYDQRLRDAFGQTSSVSTRPDLLFV